MVTTNIPFLEQLQIIYIGPSEDILLADLIPWMRKWSKDRSMPWLRRHRTGDLDCSLGYFDRCLLKLLQQLGFLGKVLTKLFFLKIICQFIRSQFHRKVKENESGWLLCLINANHIDRMNFFYLMTKLISYFDSLQTPNEWASFKKLFLFSEYI